MTTARRGRVGHGIAHTLTTSPDQGVLCFVDMNEQPDCTGIARCLTAKQNGGIRNHKREASGVLCGTLTGHNKPLNPQARCEKMQRAFPL